MSRANLTFTILFQTIFKTIIATYKRGRFCPLILNGKTMTIDHEILLLIFPNKRCVDIDCLVIILLPQRSKVEIIHVHFNISGVLMLKWTSEHSRPRNTCLFYFHRSMPSIELFRTALPARWNLLCLELNCYIQQYVYFVHLSTVT